MDFFAAGGFQQLFSDLHEQQVDALQFRNAETFHTFDDDDVFAKNSCSTYAPLSDESEEFFGAIPNFSNYNYADYAEIPATDAVVINNHFVDLNATAAATFDYNNNDLVGGSGGGDDTLANISDKQLQQSLDFLLPADDRATTDHDEPDAICEMSDWEEKFLDNYIEIPELIDFLPAKTPLCTEMCELHLLESSQQLQLHQQQKQSKRSSSSSAVVVVVPGALVDPERGGYACSYGQCRKIYAKPAHLKAHLRRHLGEKPYVCTWPECAWKFSRSDELARHRRSHSGVKPYKCDYCTKCFARSDHLTKHRKVHERRMLAASESGRAVDGVMPQSVFTVRPGRKRKNQIC